MGEAVTQLAHRSKYRKKFLVHSQCSSESTLAGVVEIEIPQISRLRQKRFGKLAEREINKGDALHNDSEFIVVCHQRDKSGVHFVWSDHNPSSSSPPLSAAVMRVAAENDREVFSLRFFLAAVLRRVV